MIVHQPSHFSLRKSKIVTMKEIFEQYLKAITIKFTHLETSEMGYRSDFEILLQGIFETIKVRRIDHDAKAAKGNKPDFVVLNHDVPILYIEAKDIGISLDKVEKSEQMTRYFGYANLVLTDYIEFRFYRNGIRYEEPIKIANYDIKNRALELIPANYEFVAKTMLDFAQSHKEPIRSGGHLSKIMGGKAQRIRDNVRQFLSSDSERNAELLKVYNTFKELLVHDLTKESFADMYAQTLVYGLFAARYHDKTEDNFTRLEARDLIPKSNPFLRQFFDHIIGPDFDKRLEYIVDELCVVFSHANVPDLMEEYFKGEKHESLKKGPDPIIHFYEDFLEEYDPILRKKMGAYYTPLPVVEFIVNAVDELLVKEFGLVRGLSDNSKNSDGTHKVQVLDPAVGTGTFISAVIGKVYSEILKRGQKGSWPAYVQNDLLPRLHGFELMMTPYTIAHLKLSIAFEKTGFKYFNNKRLGIYLTNSLESNLGQMKFPTSFGLAESIAEESKEASKIKNETPIMIVLGNPPYAGESSNKDFTGHIVYKLEPAGGKLQEKNSKWLNDDYVKFIRFAESLIEKNDDGIVAMITAHGYIDNPTFRGMRSHLMNTFNKIYILDLHGNSNKKEKAPDGSEDKNVFDIKTGVSIFFGVKNKVEKSDKGSIYQADLFGKRVSKFGFLNNNSISTVKWTKIIPVGPNYEWVALDKTIKKEYEGGISLNRMFTNISIGLQSHRDNLVTDYNKKSLSNRFRKIFSNEDLLGLKISLNLKESNDWKLQSAINKETEFKEPLIRELTYRPFDERYIYYSDNFVDRTRKAIGNRITKESLVLNFPKITKLSWNHILVTKSLPTAISLDINGTYFAPLFLYDADGSKKSNLDKEEVEKIENIVGKVAPEDIFDYIYSVLHSLNYRKKYNEFLKIDFPRIPYPKEKESFKKLVKLGGELRELHLLEPQKVNDFITTFPETGSDTVEKIEYIDGNVFINSVQYFGNVPETAWSFYIGGYQPAQKWLKDRRGRTLTNDDIEHYQKMIVALIETDRIMKEIDQTDFM